MTRVSESSNTTSLLFAANKAKKKLQDLQMRGASLKDVTRPSDNPVNNVEALAISSMTSDNKQYLRNINHALLQLSTTEKSVEEVTDILVKAKELAIAQASDLYNEDIRRNITNEVVQLRNRALAIANKRIGSKYLFAGYSTLEKPFDEEGKYHGDTGKIRLEISKDYFLPVNLTGEEVFFSAEKSIEKPYEPIKELNKEQDIKPKDEKLIPDQDRSLASVDENAPVAHEKFGTRSNVFSMLRSFASALENNDAELIQNLLEKFDDSISRLITLRTRIGSITNSILETRGTLEGANIDNAARKSQLLDADIAELFTDLTKQQEVLKTTYRVGANLVNKSLLDFLR